MDRRTFLAWVGAGWVASSLPIAIAACSSDSAKSDNSNNKATAANPTANPTARADGFQPVGTVADLDRKGQILNKRLASGPVLVIRNPDDTNSLAAVNPTCTHKGCTVAWKTNKKLFVCPCHDAEFAVDGKVVEGPAKKPLPIYQAKIEGDAVLVKVS